MLPASIRIWGLEGIPEIKPGDNLCSKILESLRTFHSAQRRDASQSGQDHSRLCGPEAIGFAEGSGSLIHPGSIVVVTQKIVSKSEGRVVALETVVPSPRAREWASRHGKDPRVIELVLRETRRVVRMDRGVLIVETRHGLVCANGGVDTSNAPPGCAVLLPQDPDESARRLREELAEALKIPVGVIVSDTFGRPWRKGLTNLALGVAGFSPFIDYRGQVDSYGRTLSATVLAVADELAAAAELVMGKTRRVPVAVIEGFPYQPADGSGRMIIRPAEEDLFP